MKMFKWLFRIIILVTIAYLIYIVVYPFMVDVSSLKRKNPDLTAMMKYRIEQWEREGKKVKIKKVWVPLHKISQYLVKAVLIGEDDKFYKHSGFDIEGIKKSN